MARPIKEGMDYFPMDVTLNVNIELIEAKYGMEGFAVIIRLMQMIYGGRGYYCEWSEDIELLFAKKNTVDKTRLSEIVNAALDRGVFDKDMFNRYGILTSADIQSRYSVAKRNSCATIKDEYALIEIPKKKVYDTKTEVYDTKTGDTDVNNTTKESKENKSKENKNKEEENNNNDVSHPDITDVKNYCNEIGIMIDCEKFVNHYNSKGWRINGSSLIDWKSRVKAWYREDIERQRAAPKILTQKPKGVFNNYNQKIYTAEEINEILMRKMKGKV